MKKRFDRKIAIAAAKEIVDYLLPVCERIILAGSLRRQKLKVGDIEIVYVPKFGIEKVDLLETRPSNLVDRALEGMIEYKIIAKRKNVLGSEVWGEKNKLAVHVETGIPVDFFATTLDCWFNYLVCRTGGARNNQIIAEAYQRNGCTWNPYGRGFTNRHRDQFQNRSEAEVYENCGLAYLHPSQRP